MNFVHHLVLWRERTQHFGAWMFPFSLLRIMDDEQSIQTSNFNCNSPSSETFRIEIMERFHRAGLVLDIFWPPPQKKLNNGMWTEAMKKLFICLVLHVGLWKLSSSKKEHLKLKPYKATVHKGKCGTETVSVCKVHVVVEGWYFKVFL
jgi:hypothetical protein